MRRIADLPRTRVAPVRIARCDTPPEKGFLRALCAAIVRLVWIVCRVRIAHGPPCVHQVMNGRRDAASVVLEFPHVRH